MPANGIDAHREHVLRASTYAFSRPAGYDHAVIEWLLGRRALPRSGEAVVVHTKDDRSFLGLWGYAAADGYVLRSPVVLPERERLPGDIVLVPSNVSFVQRRIPEEMLEAVTEAALMRATTS